MFDLTAFQRDLLFAVNNLDGASGQDIKSKLEQSQDRELSRTRLYSNLDALVENQLVEKRYENGRSKQYSTTEKGQRTLRSRFEWEEQYLSASA